MAPPLVCVSVSDADGVGQLYHHSKAYHILRQSLELAAGGDAMLVGHHIAYDMAVFAAHDPDLMPLIFAAYDADGIIDTMLNEMMLDLYHGQLRMKWDEETEAFTKVGYSLGDIVKRRFEVELDKDAEAGSWRMRYGELRDLPLEQWPERAKVYPKDDAIYTRRAAMAQLNYAASGAWDLLNDAPNQAACAFGLQLMTVWGITTDGEAIHKLETNLRATFVEHKAALLDVGLLKVKVKKRPDELARDTKKIKAGVLATLGDLTPLTQTGLDLVKKGTMSEAEALAAGYVSTSAETLAMTLDPVLMRVGEYVSTQKLLNTYIKQLWEGANGTPIHARFNSLLETGRTSASHNMQTPPRAGGVRECYVPRPGYDYVSVDLDTAELRALAQCTKIEVGYSKLAELYRKDPNADPHIILAAQMLGITEADAMARKKAGDPVVKQARQQAKAANFGFPGGMGPDRFVATQRKAGMVFSRDQAAILKDTYLDTWSEMRDYFRWVNDIAEGSGRFRSWANGLYRGGCGFCDGANYGFQAPIAAMAKRANYEAAKEMYAVSSSPLFGSRAVNFLHDELFAEVPSDPEHGTAAAKRLAEILCEVSNRYCPDVPITASPARMTRWRKGAEPVYENGLLVPWEPEVKA